jgi:putative FmdB family regulatory protein
MPTYEYLCRNCGHTLEELQSMSEPPLTRCPRCEQETLVRVMGTGGGLIFKGSGFYLTDYKKASTTPSGTSTSKEKKDSTSPGSSAPPPASSPSSSDAAKKD